MTVEKIGISASIVGAFIVGIYGVGMAWYTNSDAILLDGMFNLLSVVLSIGSLIVSNFVSRGYTKNHPWGFYAYEACIILVKGLFVLGLVVMALYSNITILLSGGREPNIEGMLVYGIPALLINVCTLGICYKAYQKSKTGLIKAEYQSWLINTLITSAIVFSLGIVFFLQDTIFGWIARYIDQILVVILCIITIMDPINLIKGSFKELMLQSINEDYRNKFKSLIEQACYQSEQELWKLDEFYVLKIGRSYFVTVDILFPMEERLLKEFLTFQNTLKTLIQKKFPSADLSINLIER